MDSFNGQGRVKTLHPFSSPEPKTLNFQAGEHANCIPSPSIACLRVTLRSSHSHPFSPDEIIIVIEVAEGGWSLGKLRGVRGKFPTSYATPTSLPPLDSDLITDEEVATQLFNHFPAHTFSQTT
jgi:hypothetical protein